ncbi:MAG: hypothetical protein HY716_01765 [Planctomycetes bacterium]|nr:hypothetical protein [Planctomycetota bacterium]
MIWTGTDVLIWGGSTGASPPPTSSYYNDGYRYDPGSNTWLGTISSTGAPSARSFHTAVWTGSQMIIWGGYDGSGSVSTGGRCNPEDDTWVAPTTTVGAPTARQSHSGIWTGSKLIVSHGAAFGGQFYNTGGIYAPPIPAIGMHTGTITVTAVGASNTPQTITVNLTVTP